MQKNLPIGNILVNNGYITEKQLERALEVQKKMTGKRLGDVLIELSYVTEQDMLKCLSERVKAPFVDLKSYRVNSQAVSVLNEATAKKYKMLAIDFKNNLLVVATNDPLDFYAFDEIRIVTGYEVTTVLATKADINHAIEKYYTETNVQSAVADINKEHENDFINEDLMLMGERVEGTPIVKLVNTIIAQSYLRGASDIHIEPFKEQLVIRIRLDGELVHHTTMNISAHHSIITRLKILSGMNIAEKRIPQDGRFRFESGNIAADIRISSIPTINGEKMVLRLLNTDNSERLLKISEIGMETEDLDRYVKMLKSPNGVVLVTGPTGSGKTTTLYATLNHLAMKNVNIITVEDPVERPIQSVNQVQVNAKAGLTFVTALRSILRQDPDVIMIGEMRDSETASIGIRAAVTGHLVLTTIHTNDTVSTIARLIDMGVESYMVGAAISGIIAQRLVKILCPHCKEKFEANPVQRLLFDPEVELDNLYRAVGCEQCDYTGYKGRTAIYELVEVDGGMRELISKGASVYELKEYEKNKGTKFLKDSIMRMTLLGQTSLDEMEKIFYSID